MVLDPPLVHAVVRKRYKTIRKNSNNPAGRSMVSQVRHDIIGLYEALEKLQKPRAATSPGG